MEANEKNLLANFNPCSHAKLCNYVRLYCLIVTETLNKSKKKIIE